MMVFGSSKIEKIIESSVHAEDSASVAKSPKEIQCKFYLLVTSPRALKEQAEEKKATDVNGNGRCQFMESYLHKMDTVNQ